MIYIINKSQNGDKDTIKYRGFDTYSDSVMVMGQHILKGAILDNKIQVMNASIQNENIVIKDWSADISSNQNKINKQYLEIKYVILAKDGNWYKLVDSDGSISILRRDIIENFVLHGKIANCELIKTKAGNSIKALDIYEIQRDEGFEELIKEKYTNFIAKTILLGYGDVSFHYEIENHTVRIKKYRGSSQDIILPPFITAISKGAFYLKDITSIRLNEGLKTIGTLAFGADGIFDDAGIERIEIPSTVEIIGQGAFRGNNKLFRAGVSLNNNRFKLLNNKTIVL